MIVHVSAQLAVMALPLSSEASIHESIRLLGFPQTPCSVGVICGEPKWVATVGVETPASSPHVE